MKNPLSLNRLLAAAILLGSLASAPCAGQGGGGTFPPAPRDYRGTNYFCSMAVGLDNITGMLPPVGSIPSINGNYQRLHIEAEIARLAASGLNNIRWFPSFYAYLSDRAAYMSELRHMAQTCAANGISITYVIWTGIGLTQSTVAADGQNSPELWHELIGTNPTDPIQFSVYQGAVLRSILQNQAFTNAGGTLPPGEPYFSSVYIDPGNELIDLSGDYTTWPYDMKTRVDNYLDEITTFFATDPDGIAAFASYDLFNEPNGASLVEGVPLLNYLRFIKTTYDRMVTIHPNAHYTVGWAGYGPELDQLDQTIVAMGIGRTYISIHTYADANVFDRSITPRVQYSDSLGLDTVVSEFHRADWNAGALKYSLDTLTRIGAGGQMWGFLQSNCFHPFGNYGFQPIDGIYVPQLTGNPNAPLAFIPNNPSDVAAVQAWATGQNLAGPYTTLEARDSQGNTVGALSTTGTYQVAVNSTRIGEPVVLLSTLLAAGSSRCTYPLFPGCSLIPGIGFTILDSDTQVTLSNLMPMSGTEIAWTGFSPDPSIIGQTLALSTYVGFYPGPQWSQNEGELSEVLLLPIY